MVEQVLFVDLENVQRVDLTQVPNGARVMVFYGVMQKKLPEELVVQAQPLGERLTWIKISGQGPNALDFHIAFYLGHEFAHRPTSNCAILSRDTGFDPLIRHLLASGRACRRVSSLVEAFPERARAVEADHFSRLMRLLRKEQARPTRLRGLRGKVKCWFPDLSDDQRAALVQRLIREARVREAGRTLTYDLE